MVARTSGSHTTYRMPIVRWPCARTIGVASLVRSGGTAAETYSEYATALCRKNRALPEAERRQLKPTEIPFGGAQLDEPLWVNCVGTFGIGSAGYWWGRVGALLVRLSHYLPPRHLAPLWLLLYADDGDGVAGGPRFEASLLFHLFLLQVLGTPLKWAKVRGGVRYEWIGYAKDYARFELGVSEARATW